MNTAFGNNQGNLEQGNSAELRAWCSKKAFEIAYALFRIGSGITKHQSFSNHIEDSSLKLLRYFSEGNFNSAIAELGIIDSFVKLGEETGLIHSINANRMFAESLSLNSAIAELVRQSQAPFIAELDDIFMRENQPPVVIHKEAPKAEVGQSKKEVKEMKQDIFQEDEEDDAIRVAQRQSAILQLVEQFGDCRFKTVQDAFPDVSERTLRYDLQHLLEEGLLDRIGGGGPGTSYRLREMEPRVDYRPVSA